MRERPILFSAPMVQALLAGTKTQTRRAAKLTDAGHAKEPRGHRRWHPGDPDAVAACPYGKPGDRLWVRETFVIGYPGAGNTYSAIPWTGADPQKDGKVFYRADGDDPKDGPQRPWTPSIHMPRWASRITISPREAVVLYLPGPMDLDRAEALRRGFSSLNLIGVERNDDLATSLRKRGVLCIHGNLLQTARAMCRNHRVDVIYGDFVSGLERKTLLGIVNLLTFPNLRDTVFVFNFQRGRDATSNYWREAAQESYFLPSRKDHPLALNRAFSLQAYLLECLIVRINDSFLGVNTEPPPRTKMVDHLLETGQFAMHTYRSRKVTMDTLVFVNPARKLYRFEQPVERPSDFEPLLDRRTSQHVAAVLAVRTGRQRQATA